VYRLEGQLLEVCSCNVLCPCWVAEDPDDGYCATFVAYQIEQGQVRGVHVAGLTLVRVSYFRGNILKGTAQTMIFVDAAGSEEQRAALLEAFGGKLGGALADVAKLYLGEVPVRVAPITYRIAAGRGTIQIGEALYGEMAPFHGPNGAVTRLVDSAFSTIPGSPAYVSKASTNRVHLPAFQLEWEYHGRNAIQGHFLFEA